MADFDLTQTGAQVQSILNDAQDAQGAGAQTTLTTDYIMLKGTNGRYHKIQKDSFTEAVRNVLAGLLVNNDKGTTISQVAAIASGDFGSITPANLASVLGAPVPQSRPDNFNPDNCVDGFYHFQASAVDYGFPVNEGGVVFIQLSALKMAQRVQLLFVEHGQGAYYKVVWSSTSPSQVSWSVL